MKKLSKDTKFAHLGKPGSIFSNGFQRRLNLITDVIDLKGKNILDLGCGEGVWLRKFLEFTSPENVYGSDIDQESIDIAIVNTPELKNSNLVVSKGESLPFKENYFDIVFQNEVLEHVTDDKKVINECLRILKPEGKLIIFTPNRGWPFETHGMFFKNRYYWGNIPLLPWLPKFVYKKFAPHVRNYSNRELKNVIKDGAEDISYTIFYHKHIFPGFDGMTRRFGVLGKVFQSIFRVLEKTPLHFFGISHFIIVKKS